MKENLDKNKPEKKLAELKREFESLDDLGVAHSVITGELLKSGEEGEKLAVEKIRGIKNEAVKNDALFRLAEFFYENNGDADSALKTVAEISDEDEKARCLVHLANDALKNKNPELAERLIGQIGKDEQNYKSYFEREKEKYLSAEADSKKQ